MKIHQLHVRAAGVLAALCLIATGIAGCGSTSTGEGDPTTQNMAPSNDGGSGSDSPAKIGLILHSMVVPRYETKDKPYFEAALKEKCPNCEFIYQNAADDSAKELQQAQSMLAQGVDVLVIDSVDGKAMASVVNSAKAQDVPVIAYDRPIDSPDVAFAIANDYVQVGVLQGKALIDRLDELGIKPSDGGIVVDNGDQNDQGSIDIKTGLHSVLDKSPFEILGEIDTWDADKAQNFYASMITKNGKKIVGVYAPNDTNAGSAIAAFKSAGWDELPPITGLDASLGGIQNIVAGLQYMTVYNPFRDEGEQAAAAAVALAHGKSLPDNEMIDGIPTYMTTPQAVTVKNIADTVIKDKFWTAEEICTSEYADDCVAAGIK